MQLTINKISKSYGNNKVLSEFSAILTPGVYLLLGPNGSGKSTLLNIVADNEHADSGSITYAESVEGGNDLFILGKNLRHLLGLMPQRTSLHPNSTVKQALEKTARLKNIGNQLKGDERRQYIAYQISQLLSAVNLNNISDCKIKKLSQGARQRLALAQAVLGNPKILLLDNPLSGLDPRQRSTICDYISKLAPDRIIIIATQFMNGFELIADQVFLIDNGLIVDQATPAALINKIKNKVWSIRVSEEQVASTQQNLYITHINRDEQANLINLRVLSDTKPLESATNLIPTLEDYYHYLFPTN